MELCNTCVSGFVGQATGAVGLLH